MQLNFDAKYKYAKPRRGNAAKCFILGTAPSLETEDLSLLNGWPVFCCNKAWLAQKMLNLDKCNWIVYTGLASWENDIEEMKEYGPSGIPMVSDLIAETNIFQNYVKENPHDYYVFPKRAVNKDWSKRLSEGYLPEEYSQGWGKAKSVVMDAIVIAYLMGFTEIYLLGVDMDYTAHRFYFFEANAWHLKVNRPTVRDKGYEVLCKMTKALAEKDVKLVNLSKGFKPEIFPKFKGKADEGNATAAPLPTGILEDVVEGIYKHKVRGIVCDNFSPLDEGHIAMLWYARQGCDILFAGVKEKKMLNVVEAIRGVDRVISCKNLSHGIHKMLEEFPRDKVRVFYNEADSDLTSQIQEFADDDRVGMYPTDKKNIDWKTRKG